MARRIKRVAPDVLFQDRAGDQYEVVSREALIQALADWVTVLEHQGGMLHVLVSRSRTNVGGEAVTTEALVTWQDRTTTKDQPEQEDLLDEFLGPLPEPSEDDGEPEEAPEPALAEG